MHISHAALVNLSRPSSAPTLSLASPRFSQECLELQCRTRSPLFVPFYFFRQGLEAPTGALVAKALAQQNRHRETST